VADAKALIAKLKTEDLQNQLNKSRKAKEKGLCSSGSLLSVLIS
jgi:hypothetical protein